MPSLHLVPAYGRDYDSAAAVAAAWNDGHDFRVADIGSKEDGRYCNKADVKDQPSVNIRYARLAKVVILYRHGESWSRKPLKVRRSRRT